MRGHVAWRWIAIVMLFGSLIVLAALPGATGLAAAALVWLAAYFLFEWGKPRRSG